MKLAISSPATGSIESELQSSRSFYSNLLVLALVLLLVSDTLVAVGRGLPLPTSTWALAVLFVLVGGALTRRTPITRWQLILGGAMVAHLVAFAFVAQAQGAGLASAAVLAHVILAAIPFVAGRLTLKTVSDVLVLSMSISLILAVVMPEAVFSLDARAVISALGRFKGVWGHPNIMGTVAVLGVILHKSSRRPRYALSISCGVALITLSYGAILSGVAALIYWRFARNQTWPVVVAVAGAASIPLMLALSAAVPGHYFTGRVTIWRTALEVGGADRFGSGLTFYQDRLAADVHIGAYHAHNQILQGYATGGILLACAAVVTLLVMAISAREAIGRTVVVVITVTAAVEVPLLLDFPGSRMVLLLLVMTVIARTTSIHYGPSMHAGGES